MREWLAGLARRYFSPGEDELNVPALDGPWRPNDALEQARVVRSCEQPDNLAIAPDGLYFSAGRRLLHIDDHEHIETVAEFDADISALTWHAPSGGFAVGLAGHGIAFSGGARDGQLIEHAAGALRCPTALAVDGAGTLYVAVGSYKYQPQDWVRDLMGKQRGGRIVALDADDASHLLADQVAWPQGLLAVENRVLFAESWRHRLQQLDGSHRLQNDIPLANLPGYPGRLCAAPQGGYWLTLFAMRTKLVEFVLLEDNYREQMMATIEPRYWIAPMLSSHEDHLEPLQGGAVKQLGILKPWAPPRSYGLVVRLDAQLRPLYSLHSRAAGHHHGITSAAQRGDTLYVTAKGGNAVLAIDLTGFE